MQIHLILKLLNMECNNKKEKVTALGCDLLLLDKKQNV